MEHRPRTNRTPNSNHLQMPALQLARQQAIGSTNIRGMEIKVVDTTRATALPRPARRQVVGAAGGRHGGPAAVLGRVHDARRRDVHVGVAAERV
jgi:hypothetical protein